MKLSREMEDFLHKNHKTWLPKLIIDFRNEFGYKKSGIPNSMPLKVAKRLVMSWKKEYDKNREKCD